MSANPGKGRKLSKPALTQAEIIRSRLRVLKIVIEATDSKENLNSRQTAKRNGHIRERELLERQLATLDGPNISTQTSTVVMQDVTPPEPLEFHAPLVTPANIPDGSNRPAFQNSSRETSAKPSPVHRQCAKLSTVTTPTILHRPAVNLSIRTKLPLRARPKDQKQPPSAASGGIPEPSQMYNSLCNNTPELASEAQNLLLVIDLNGTLLYRPSRDRPQHFIERPSTQQFLNYAMANFSVMIWSSAKPKNVGRMCEKLFTEESRAKLVAVWGRDRLGLSTADYDRRVQVYKRLERVWNDAEVQARHPEASVGKGWNQGNTVLIDDSVEKSRSEPHNFIEVVEFKGCKEDQNMLKDLAEYLATLRMQMNVSSYIRQSPLRIKNGYSPHQSITV